MDDPADRLARWREAGLISSEQEQAILDFERGSTSARSAPPAAASRSVAVEAIGYVGGALALGAVAVILGEVWVDLVAGARLALVVLVTVLLAGAGLALRQASTAPLRRLAVGLLTASVAGVAWSVTTLTGDVATWRTSDVAVAASLAAGVTAFTFYRMTQRALLQVALLASLAASVIAVLYRPALTPDTVWFGLSVWALGIAWFLLGRGAWLRPRRTAEIFGALVALLAAQGWAWGDARTLMLSLGIATAAALVVAAVATEALPGLVMGALGLFVLVPQLVFELFGDRIGAPATLLVVGLLLVLVAVGLGRAHREVRASDGPDAPPDRRADDQVEVDR